MSVKLPYDLVEEILSRVPWKFLPKLRCVCKLWNSLILEERLNKKNLSFHMHSYSGEHRFILADRGLKISAVGIEEQQNNVNDPPSLIVQDFTLTKVRQTYEPSITVYKTVHCDGLLLCVMDNQLLVRNPLLKETSWIKCGSDFHQSDDAYCLGYLSHCDYRILRFRCASNSRNRPSRVEVCEVASKTWKVIDNISFDWFLSVPLSILSLRGTPYCIGLREDHTAFVQSYDFARERFQPIDDLPFRYDEMNPIGLEIYKGDRLSVLEQCHKTRKICIWVKHWLMLTSWTKLLVVDIPEFPLLYPRPSLLSMNYYFDKNNRLVITCNHTGMKGLSIIRVINDKDFQVIKANVSEIRFPFLCSYVPSFVRLQGFSKQDTSRIRWRKRRFN
ncbi:F-box domain-containing protein [Hirschfeldia incana]|nr:F-box domain-containing protein [Hirschfeldia incana]